MSPSTKELVEVTSSVLSVVLPFLVAIAGGFYVVVKLAVKASLKDFSEEMANTYRNSETCDLLMNNLANKVVGDFKKFCRGKHPCFVVVKEDEENESSSGD